MQIKKYDTFLRQDNTPELILEKSVVYGEETILNKPELIAEMFRQVFLLDRRTEEYVYMLALNTKCVPIGAFELYHGTVNTTVVSPREVYMKALLCGAVSVVIVHNHPSGDVTPSEADLGMVDNMKQAGVMLEVELMDSIIISSKDYYSFRETQWV